MFISYEKFLDILNQRLKSDTEELKKLLETIIDNPDRYTGLFRKTNAKTKLIQNLTQSQEIRFGDFLEDIVTCYLEIKGFTNLDKKIENSNGEYLNIDQYFTDGECIYIIEQKVRDDHDSTKKRGQFENFKKKYDRVVELYPNNPVLGAMWFIDPALKKNKKYYKSEMNTYNINNSEIMKLYYGEEFFLDFDMEEMWKEILNYLATFRIENSNDVIIVPDFDTSDEILAQLVNLSNKHWKKLISDKEKYKNLRKEIFPSGINIDRAKVIRSKEKNV